MACEYFEDSCEDCNMPFCPDTLRELSRDVDANREVYLLLRQKAREAEERWSKINTRYMKMLGELQTAILDR